MNCKGSKGRSSGKVTTERKYCSLFILSYLFFSWLLKTFQQHMLIHNCVIFYWFFFRQLQELKNIILCKNSIQNQVVSTSKSGGTLLEIPPIQISGKNFVTSVYGWKTNVINAKCYTKVFPPDVKGWNFDVYINYPLKSLFLSSLREIALIRCGKNFVTYIPININSVPILQPSATYRVDNI